jgi:hypothetical protein
MIGPAGLPDLAGSISLVPQQLDYEAGAPVQIDVTITNIGNAASAPPTAPGTPWNTVCSLEPYFGYVWVVPALDPGHITWLPISLPAICILSTQSPIDRADMSSNGCS